MAEAVDHLLPSEEPPEKRRKWTEEGDESGVLEATGAAAAANLHLQSEEEDVKDTLNEGGSKLEAIELTTNAVNQDGSNALPPPGQVVPVSTEPIALPQPPMMMPPFLFWPPPPEGMWPWMPRPSPPLIPPPRSTGIPLALQVDLEHLSDYQRLLRQQLELFAASRLDTELPTQGRKQPVRLGQVGLRCRHCARLPLRSRGRGAVYYPSRLAGLYQAAQNMALSHLQQACPVVPAVIKEQLMALRKQKDQAHGGKQYWADGCRALGCIETEEGLRFAPLLGTESSVANTRTEEPPQDHSGSAIL